MKDDASGRGRPLPPLFSFFSAALLVLFLAFAIAWPLWSLATKEKSLFSALVLALCGAAALFFAARAALRRVLRRLTRRGNRARRLP